MKLDVTTPQSHKATNRIRLTIAYVGTNYHGWQHQARKEPPTLPTIQALLEKCALRIGQCRITIHASGRTDSGVHAQAQVAHMDVPATQAHIDWQMALNHLLPHDIRIVDARLVHPDFHAQRNAISKTYMYRLWLSRRYTPPFITSFVWSCGPLEIEAMEAAAAYLIGTHDFSACKNMGTPLEHHIRTIYTISQHPPNAIGQSALSQEDDDLRWYFTANGFLKQMARNIMGLLVAVGRGKINPEHVPHIIASGDRQKAPATAPAHGLTLLHVDYGTKDYTLV